MKIKSIVIELELEEGLGDDRSMATKFTFNNCMWTTNGSIYPRYAGMLQDVYRLIRDNTVNNRLKAK